VNIWEEIESEGAGFADDDDVAGTLRLLNRWRSVPAADRNEMSRSAMTLFNNRYEISRVARSLIDSVSPFVRSFSNTASHEIIPSKKTAHRVG
jgi:hypothetical protein